MLVKRLALVALLSGSALAADRHVYLDTNGDGRLNDCPNPAHNAIGTSNTNEMSYCSGGTSANKVIGTATGRVSSSTCTGGGGTVQNLTRAVAAAGVDFDGDGVVEKGYTHPQACVYNMAKSDSCEIHAGTYRTPGAMCNGNCTTSTSPGDFRDYLATVLAYGYFADNHTDGYGTQASPGYIRGAVMNGSTDTWDADGDKQPDASQTNAVVFSGDVNRNSGTTCTGANEATCHDVTTCTTSDCTGDAFGGVWIGCNAAGGSYQFECAPAFAFGTRTGPLIDSDGDGTFNLEIGRNGAMNTDYLRIKDIKFTGYNAGTQVSNGANARHKEAIINLNGNEASNELKVEHVWITDNKANTTGDEVYWALIADMRNSGCSNYDEVKDSLLNLQNRFGFNTDGSPQASNGCSWNIHDNRILFNSASSVAGRAAVMYMKNIDFHPDGRPVRIRFYNNEVVVHSSAASNGGGWLIDLQDFGNSGGAGKGELWIFGNLFRNDPGFTTKYNFFYPTSCSENNDETHFGHAYIFNNTFDGWLTNNRTAISGGTPPNIGFCNNAAQLSLFVERNNIWLAATQFDNTTVATTLRRANEFSTDANKCLTTSLGYFDCGFTPGDYNAIPYYMPHAGGPLDEVTANSPCDPDGDGTLGFDFDGNGTNDLTWTDLAGHTVDCSASTNPTGALDMGAIQNSSDGGGGGPVCGNNTREAPEVCDGTDLNSQTCISQGFAGGTLSCNAGCTAFVTTSCTIATTQNSKIQGALLTGGAIH